MKQQLMSWWVLPIIFYVTHFLAVIAFGASSADLTGPKADAGSMAWIIWFIIDFPIGIIAVSIGESFSSNWMGVLAVALIGGIQWIFYGLSLTYIIREAQIRRQVA